MIISTSKKKDIGSNKKSPPNKPKKEICISAHKSDYAVESFKRKEPIPRKIEYIHKICIDSEINKINNSIKELIEKINSFIKFEELSKIIEEKLPGTELNKIGSFSNNIIFPNPTFYSIDLLLQINKRDSKHSSPIKKFSEIFDIFKNIPNIELQLPSSQNEEVECIKNNKISFNLSRTDLEEKKNIKNSGEYPFNYIKINLYAYHQIYGFSSYLISRIFKELPNVRFLHLIYQNLLLKEYPLLKSNYELCILIFNYLECSYQIFDKKLYFKESFYFSYDKPKKDVFLIDTTLKKYSTEFHYFEASENIKKVKEKSIKQLAIEFHHFLFNYLNYILHQGKPSSNNNKEFDKFKDRYFLNDNFIFTRFYLDRSLFNYMLIENNEFDQIKNKFSSISFE